jgi:hypothetical protein
MWGWRGLTPGRRTRQQRRVGPRSRRGAGRARAQAHRHPPRSPARCHALPPSAYPCSLYVREAKHARGRVVKVLCRLAFTFGGKAKGRAPCRARPCSAVHVRRRTRRPGCAYTRARVRARTRIRTPWHPLRPPRPYGLRMYVVLFWFCVCCICLSDWHASCLYPHGCPYNICWLPTTPEHRPPPARSGALWL